MAHLFEVKSQKDSIIDFVTEKFNHHKEIMTDIHRTWSLNLAWTRGYQNVDYDKNSGSFHSLSDEKTWRPRLVTNLMLPIVRRNVSQIIHMSNVWDVIPATADEEDIDIAMLGNQLLSHYWQKLGMSKTLIRIAFWQSTCSSAFLKVGWDADKGDELAVISQEVEEEVLSNYLEFMGLPEAPEILQVPEGDLFAVPISPFNMIVDDNVQVFDDAQWCIETQIRSLDWIVETYGTKWKKLQETSECEVFLYPFVFGEHVGKIKKTGVIHHDFYIKKSRKFKDGSHAIIAGGELIHKDKNPYEHRKLPYVHFLEIYDPASLHGTNSAEQIRPQQAKYNRVQSAVLENINLMSNLQWLNPNQSGIQSFTNRPGRVFNYTYPYKPEMIQPRSIPAFVDRFLDRTRLDIQDTASNHDVSEAKAEPGVRSGRAVLALQDADDSIKGPMLLWFDTSLAEAGCLALHTLHQFITQEKLIEVTGEYNEIETVSFKGEYLVGKSKADYFKVRCRTYGRQPLSRSAREGLARTLVELGLLHPDIHREELLQILAASDIMSTFDRSNIDRVRQNRELEVMVQGEQVEVYFGQNHDAHIRVIKKFISSSKWDKLDKQQKDAVSTHFRQHLEQQAIETIYQPMFIQGLTGVSNGQRGSESRQSGSKPGSEQRQANREAQRR